MITPTQSYIQRRQLEKPVPYPQVDGLSMVTVIGYSESQAAKMMGDIIKRQAANKITMAMDSN